MFTKTLSQNATGALALLGKSDILKEAYLAGGTACALQLGHRVSLDLDFFTDKEFPAAVVLKQLEQLPGFKLDETTKWTILGSFPKVKFSYFYYPYPLIKKPTSYSQINIASLEDIVAMKTDAISSRGTKRDFIDLYFLTKMFSLNKVLKLYNQKYHKLSENIYHIISSLNYFADADPQKLPKMLIKISWYQIKDFFRKEVVKLGRDRYKI